MSTLEFAATPTPSPSDAWRSMSEDQRADLITRTLEEQAPEILAQLEIVETMIDGQIIVKLLEPMAANKRGGFLLDFEELLKNAIDPGLVVWLSPLGDKNVLRNLRGIEVKS